MKAQELRIGNLVLRRRPSDKEPEWVELTVNPTYLVLIQNYPEDYKPIPLTEEWLVKFEINDKTKTTVCFYLTNCGGNEYAILLKRDHFATAFVEHVHELQNLYFALTGEELTIKP